ncbi:MAG TPA: type II CAAX endopeptidase family protein [Gemmatimonadaceae bacterium]|nr:type II CAAX endopeptidase family protein [Gemmatimonadaceae bacterium]
MRISALFLSAQGRLRSGWRAALFLVLFTTFAEIGQAVVAIPGWLGGSPGSIVAAEIPLTWIAIVAAGLAAHLVMLVFVDRTGWSYVGLAPVGASGRRVATGFALGALAIAVPCALLLAFGWLDMVRDPASAPRFGRELLTVLAVLVPAALAEELMMRGYLLSALSDGMGRVASLVVTSVVFALMHVNNPGMEPGALVVVGLAGIFLGAVRFATSSLYAAWAAHLAWNVVLGVLLHALVSGTSMAAAGWRTLDSGPDWATGGTWGPEGGVPAAAGLLVATWYLIGRHRAAFGGLPFTRRRGEPATGAPAPENGIRA